MQKRVKLIHVYERGSHFDHRKIHLKWDCPKMLILFIWHLYQIVIPKIGNRSWIWQVICKRYRCLRQKADLILILFSSLTVSRILRLTVSFFGEYRIGFTARCPPPPGIPSQPVPISSEKANVRYLFPQQHGTQGTSAK